MAEHQLPKLNTRVRFPSSAPNKKDPLRGPFYLEYSEDWGESNPFDSRLRRPVIWRQCRPQTSAFAQRSRMPPHEGGGGRTLSSRHLAAVPRPNIGVRPTEPYANPRGGRRGYKFIFVGAVIDRPYSITAFACHPTRVELPICSPGIKIPPPGYPTLANSFLKGYRL